MESMLYQGHRFFRWHKAFLDGRDNVEDELHCGRPCMSKTDKNVTKVRDLVRSDLHLTFKIDQLCVEFESPNRPQNFDLRTGHAENLCQAGPQNSHQ